MAVKLHGDIVMRLNISRALSMEEQKTIVRKRQGCRHGQRFDSRETKARPRVSQVPFSYYFHACRALSSSIYSRLVVIHVAEYIARKI
mmetsp:Transcript_36609/g.80086  ORF Transcript_36609/g.80086 Transcript_36609/m.80086 type:complete len:88 (+) Transcript_36609:160-423(+)